MSQSAAAAAAVTAPQAVVHSTFTVERRLAASPERVYRAWSDREAKAKWFGGSREEWTQEIRDMDFRVGGTERVRGAWAHGMVSDFQARYLDIVPNQRIVYVYDMIVNERKLSVSLATIQLIPEGDGTRMLVTEQGAYFGEEYFGGQDATASRVQGTNTLMDALARSLD